MAYQQMSTAKRALYLDQIRAIIIAFVIAIHVPMAFGGIGWSGVRIPVEESIARLLLILSIIPMH